MECALGSLQTSHIVPPEASDKHVSSSFKPFGGQFKEQAHVNECSKLRMSMHEYAIVCLSLLLDIGLAGHDRALEAFPEIHKP